MTKNDKIAWLLQHAPGPYARAKAEAMNELDIPEHPYCRRCLDKAKIEVLIKSFAFSEKQAKAFVKMNNIMNDKNE